MPEGEPSADAADEVAPAAASPDSLAAVLAALPAWVNALMDTTGRNPLLYYKSSSGVDLSEGDPRALKRLLAGESVRVRELFPDPEENKAIAAVVDRMRKRIQAYDEELGVSIGRVTSGMVAWTERDDNKSRKPAAPLFLRQVTITQPQRGTQDFVITVEPDVEVNEVLLHLFARDYHVQISAEQIEDLAEKASTDFYPATDALHDFAQLAGGVEGLSVTSAVNLGAYRYQKLPMVKDLQAHGELFAASDLVAAVAGSASAMQGIRASVGEVSYSDPNVVPPSDEFLVLDADPSQNYAINAALAGRNIIIQGPPGTGKSQTISNLIASFVARGKTVLFVAEKRAAIDAVTNRLSAVGLGDTILDLHDGASNKARVNASIAEAIATARAIPALDTQDIDRTLLRTRERLLQHAEALHVIREPWGVSVFDLQADVIATIPECQIPYRFSGNQIRQLDSASLREAREQLAEAAGLGAFLPLDQRSAWASASEVSEQSAMGVFENARTLSRETVPTARERFEAITESTNTRPPNSLAEWAERLALHDEVTALSNQWEPAVWQADLDDLMRNCAPRKIRKDKGWESTWSTRRAARKTAKSMLRSGTTRPDLYSSFSTAKEALAKWRSVAHNPEALPVSVDSAAAHESLTACEAGLETLGGHLHRTDLRSLPFTDLQSLLAQLAHDPAEIMKTARINDLITKLKEHDLTSFLRELAPLADRWTPHEAQVKAAQALTFAWAASAVDDVALHDPHFGAFDGNEHSSVADAYAEADRDHRDTTPHRILRKVAVDLTEARNTHGEQDTRLGIELQRKRRIKPLRDLIPLAPDVIFAAKPCWAMSPLVVSQVLPATTHFDLVVFDEASQIRPADAIPSLGRAKQAVICGDSKQLPPTNAFMETDTDAGDPPPTSASALPGGSDNEDNLGALTDDTESILDVFDAALGSTLANEYRLLWHYRSRDARLISFSNAWFYDNSLMTFPGTTVDTPVSFVPVPHPSGQPQNVANEVSAVVDLVLEHARTRPEESLGVIAMSLEHARRIENAVDEQIKLTLDPDITAYFNESADEPFFVKNLERVQGDERDAIIISLGYIKEPDGRMLYRFGPINNKGGERRLNVAASRAKNRVSLVASFDDGDLDPNRLSSEGSKALRAYLQYARSGGQDLGDKGATSRPLNPFEIHVRDRLVSAGIPVTPQYGVAGYFIDFAASHPTRPGQMVLAIEADGASYHSSETARARDRLRQEHLERLGWTFHRIWSTDYRKDPDAIIAQVLTSYQQAVDNAERVTQAPIEEPARPTRVIPEAPERAGPLRVPTGRSITDYTDRQLLEAVKWVSSDGLVRTDSELLEETMKALGFQRRGARITERINHAIQKHAKSGGLA